jgi:hypothetical protein
MSKYVFSEKRAREIIRTLTDDRDAVRAIQALGSFTPDSQMSVRAAFAVAGIALASSDTNLRGFDLDPTKPADLQYARQLLLLAAREPA